MTTLATGSKPLSAITQPAAKSWRGWYAILWLVWAACLALGSVGVYERIAHGHMPAGYGSYVPWGLWIAIYFHGVGIAGGAFAVAAVGHLAGLNGFRHPAALRAAFALAFAAMIPGLLAVWFDLGHMDRATKILLSPSFTSMMAFNAWMYTLFLGVAAVCWWQSFRKGSTWFKPFLCLGVALALVFPSQSGAFFGVVDAKPYWHSGLMPLMFFASAITAGTALLLFIRGIIGIDSPAGRGDNDPRAFGAALARLRAILLIGLIAYFAMEFAEFSIVFWDPTTHAPALDLILFGPYWWVFWIVHVGLGGIVPLALMLTRRHSAWIAASLLVAITFSSTRLNVLVPGQAVGELTGLQEAYHHPRLSYMYHATPMEYLVGLFLVGVGMTIYYTGRRISKAVVARST